MEDNKEQSVPGVGGEQFKIQLSAEDWSGLNREKLIDYFRQAFWGSHDLIDRMVNRYNQQTDGKS